MRPALPKRNKKIGRRRSINGTLTDHSQQKWLYKLIISQLVEQSITARTTPIKGTRTFARRKPKLLSQHDATN